MQGFGEIPQVVLEEMRWGENQRWLPLAIFVNGPKPYLGGHNKTNGGTTRANFEKILPVVSLAMR